MINQIMCKIGKRKRHSLIKIKIKTINYNKIEEIKLSIEPHAEAT
jgi:hypothetical protein